MILRVGEGETRVKREDVRAEIKRIISTVTGIKPETIADNASFADDLELDSLAMIEIGVEVDFAYKLALTEEEMATLQTVEEAVDMALVKLGEREA